MTDDPTLPGRLRTGPGRPAVLELDGPVTDPADWVAAHRATLRSEVDEHGALLVRGLGIADAGVAGAAGRAVVGEPMTEYEGFAPRDALGDGVYSSTKWPPDQPMCMHHELSHLPAPPSTLVFCCLRAPARGGATLLADGRDVLDGLDPDLAERFTRAGWRLTRAYNPMVGTPVESAFGTADRTEIGDYCARNALTCAWDGDGTLRTSQTRASVITHPGSGRPVWFNQIAFLNEWTMDPDVRAYLTAVLGDGALPFTTHDGSGGPLDRAAVDHVNEVYDAHTLREPWRDGDLMLVDNLRTAHAVEPHSGDREIVVVMGEPYAPPENEAFA